MAALLEVKNLTKKFGSFTAVDGISFSIPAGICFGLLGPNGAGKTTTLEMIEGISEPSAGEIYYLEKPRDKRFRLEAGIQFQATALMDFLTTRDILKLFSSFYPNPLPPEELISLCDLGDFIQRESTKLSGGQRQRLLLALALINDPQVVFLDEPTTGLDPQSRRHFWQLVQNIKQRGKTVVLTTHYMDEAELLCEELVIMDHGRIIAEGSPQALLQEHFKKVRVCLDKQALAERRDLFENDTEETDSHLEIVSDSVENALQKLIAAKVDLSSLRVRTPTLDDLFIKLTGHGLRE